MPDERSDTTASFLTFIVDLHWWHYHHHWYRLSFCNTHTAILGHWSPVRHQRTIHPQTSRICLTNHGHHHRSLIHGRRHRRTLRIGNPPGYLLIALRHPYRPTNALAPLQPQHRRYLAHPLAPGPQPAGLPQCHPLVARRRFALVRRLCAL